MVGDGWEGGEVGGNCEHGFRHTRRREQAPALQGTVFHHNAVAQGSCRERNDIAARGSCWTRSGRRIPNYGSRGIMPLVRGCGT